MVQIKWKKCKEISRKNETAENSINKKGENKKKRMKMRKIKDGNKNDRCETGKLYANKIDLTLL